MLDRNPVADMQQRYKNVFGTAEGRYVLGNILTLGHFGVTLDAENRDQVAEYNFALSIATMSGVMEPIIRQLGMTNEENYDGRNTSEL